MLNRQYKYTLLWGSEQLERKFGEKHLGLSLPGNFNLSQWNKVLLHCLIYFLDSRAWPQTDITLGKTIRDIFYHYYEINSKATTTDSWAREPFAHHKEDQGTILRSLSGAKRAGAWPTWGCWWTRWSAKF